MTHSRWIRLVCLAPALVSYPLLAGTYQDVDRPFSFELYTSDVFPWIDGTKSGPVKDARGKMARGLESMIEGTRSRLEVALYGVKKQEWFIDAVRKLVNQKGSVPVEAVIDQRLGNVGEWNPDNFDYPDSVQLASLLGDDAVKPDVDKSGAVNVNSIMHNKFIVSDRKKVWLGSANISHTDLGSEYNVNVSLLVRSPEIARLYSDEFRQMFHQQLFSTEKLPRSEQKPLRFSDGTITEVYFSPQDDTMNRAILEFIRRSSRSLDIAMFFLTDTKAATALKDAVKRGVKVRLIYDALAGAHAASKHSWLRDQGIDVRVENWGGKMHMKAAISDSSDVLLGSVNWSSAGSLKNDENTLVIRRNEKLATAMSRYYDRLWETLDDGAAGDGSSDRSTRRTYKNPRAEGKESINSCHDKIDNDHDGLVDAEDDGCS
jgi:phosphatidylserine/phosphatidylglycerophosphate/cardiolipin synthase-like enzyme